MSLTALLLGCIATLNLAIGMYVYRRNPSATSHRSFALMALSLGLWTIGLAVAHYSPAGNSWGLRVAFGAASFIPAFVVAFVEHTPHTLTAHRGIISRVFLPISLILSVVSFSPLIVVSVDATQGHLSTQYGPLHLVFGVFVIFSLLYAISVLISRYRSSNGSTKVRLGHLLLAFVIPISLAISTNLFVPLVLGSSSLSKYGPFFTLPLLALIGHSILKHRLLDLGPVIRKSAVYLAASLTASLVLVTFLSLSNAIVHDDSAIPVREVLLALAVAIFFGPLKTSIQRACDRYLFRDPYSYQQIVSATSHALRGTSDLAVLLTHVSSVVLATLKPGTAAIYLLNEGGQLELTWFVGGRYPSSLPLSSSVLRTVTSKKDIVCFNHSDQQREDMDGPSVALIDTDVVVVAPLIEESDVIGLLCVGPKRSGDQYSSDDIDLLATLSNQSAVAIRNAQSHRRVMQLNEELQAVLGTMESGVVATGERGQITLFNYAAERLVGIPGSKARSRSIHDLPTPLAECLAGTLSAGQSRSQIEFCVPDGAGQVIPLSCSTSPLLNSTGRPSGAVAVVSDISHLKQLEHEKRRAERLASIEAIAAGLVHEIRNPLVAIKTFSQLLPKRYEDPEFRETFSRTASREIRRIDDLLTRFRTLASASLEPTAPISIGEPIQHALDLLQPEIEERQIQVRRVCDGVPRAIIGSVSQLEQLFLNLCLNAIEAMEPGGELTLRVADLSDGDGTTLLAEISDTGPGIPDELLAKIFDPFVSTKARGSGLGLAICRAIADAHRARLIARNNVGRPGSTFTIEFPVAAATPSVAAAAT